MKKLTPDQWMGVGLALMAVGVLTLSVMDMQSSGVGTTRARRGDPMPALEGHTLEGAVQSLSAGDTGGPKVLLIDFWATWCPPCVREMPVLAGLHQAFQARGVKVLAVNEDSGNLAQRTQTVRRFLGEHRLELPVLLDDGRSASAWGIQAFPTLVVVGADGRVRETFAGLTSRALLVSAIESALADSESSVGATSAGSDSAAAFDDQEIPSPQRAPYQD